MTCDDITRMAREAGIPRWHDHGPLTEEHIERFAALVAAAEREACAAVCDSEVKRLSEAREPRAALVAGICAAVIRARSKT